MGTVWFNRIIQKGYINSTSHQDYIANQVLESNKIQWNSDENDGIIGTFDVYWNLISANTNVFDQLFRREKYYIFPQIDGM